MRENIAIVDDEEDIVELVVHHLNKNSYTPHAFYDAQSFLDSLKKELPDLLILDLMLPDLNGIDVCKTLKNTPQFKKIPVIMLTAKQEEIDKIIGLEIGADDYVTKPFSPRELIARVKAVLRRVKEYENQKEKDLININGTIIIDIKKHEVFDSHKNSIDLTATEFKILKILAESPGWVFSREKLLAKIWGEEKYVIDRTIDVHIKHLREKLGQASYLIKNIRGVGYKLEDKK